METSIQELESYSNHADSMMIKANRNYTRFLITFLDQDSIGTSYCYAIGNEDAALVFSHYHKMTSYDESDFINKVSIQELKDHTGIHLNGF